MSYPVIKIILIGHIKSATASHDTMTRHYIYEKACVCVVGNTTIAFCLVGIRGIATKATMLILEYAFEDLGLNKVYLTVDANNEKACGLYERVGMSCEGLFREDLFHQGKLIDRKRYAILKRDWNCGWRDE